MSKQSETTLEAGLAEDYFWLTTEPTVADLMRLNRESWFLFPLPMLLALSDIYGGSLEKIKDAVVKQRLYETPSVVDMQYLVVVNGKIDVILRPTQHGYVACRTEPA